MLDIRAGLTNRMANSNTLLPDEERRSASSLLSALEPFRDIRSDMPLQYVTTLLLVATGEGKSVNEYARRAGVSKSVMSRHILDLSIRLRSGEDGLGLLVSKPSPESLRQHEVYLTPRGRALLFRVLRSWRLGQ